MYETNDVITGSYMLSQIDEEYSENDVEKAFHNSLIKASKFLSIRKHKIGNGTPDGIIRLFDVKSHKLDNWLIHECKRCDGATAPQIQFLQAMVYAGNILYDYTIMDIEKRNFSGILLSTSSTIIYIARKDIDVIGFETIWKNNIHNIIPCKAFMNSQMLEWACRTYVETAKFKLNDTNFSFNSLINSIYLDYHQFINEQQ